MHYTVKRVSRQTVFHGLVHHWCVVSGDGEYSRCFDKKQEADAHARVMRLTPNPLYSRAEKTALYAGAGVLGGALVMAVPNTAAKVAGGTVVVVSTLGLLGLLLSRGKR